MVTDVHEIMKRYIHLPSKREDNKYMMFAITADNGYYNGKALLSTFTILNNASIIDFVFFYHMTFDTRQIKNLNVSDKNISTTNCIKSTIIGEGNIST